MNTIVLTGATRGIGAVAARHLAAEPGRTLVLLARTPGDVTAVADAAGAGATVRAVEADLSSIAGTARAADEVARLVASGAVPPLDALVLNAGVQRVDALGESADGIETTFAVNVVANHVLVRALAPQVRPGGRVVVTVSDTHVGDLRHNLGMVPGPRWRAPQRLARPGSAPRPGGVRAGRTAYSTSKLAAIYQVHAYARDYPRLTVAGYNPGFVPGTGLARHAGPLPRLAMARLLPALTRTPLASTVEQAGRRLADVVIGEPAPPTSSYVDRDRIGRSSVESYDRGREEALVRYLDDLTGTARERRRLRA